ncbi:MAG: glycosyltransferase family 4 protein [Bacteroidia bacterium]
MKIIASHLLNDYSGSPKVLMQLLKGWTKNGIETELYTCSGREGFLSEIPQVNYNYFKYTWKKNPILRLVNLMISQLSLCLKVLKNAQKQDVIYINTVLPFGAAIAGKIKNCRVIYHIHETSVSPAILKSFLFGIMKWTATDIVYVSNFLAEAEPIKGKKIHILHNAIENEFLEIAESQEIEKMNLQNILMVCSLKAYKGVFEFIALARQLPDYNFKLVLNASKTEIQEFFLATEIPSNVEMSDSQTDLHPFYRWSDLVLNLSQPESWIETFGLTILEGMAYGNPAIVPPVGGVVELVENDINGYRINSNQTDKIAEAIRNLSSETNLYKAFRKNTKEVIAKFREDYFIHQNLEILTNK